MGTNYQKSFTPFLELFEPRSVYISELRLQHTWKEALWKIPRKDLHGRDIRILGPGRHNHSDGPDFIDARIMVDGKLMNGDIELHRLANEWYNHKHHLDKRYDNCILHVIFQSGERATEARCSNGKILATCNIPLEEVFDVEPKAACRIFRPDKKEYFKILKQEGWRRANRKIKYFYDNRLRFPYDVMLYWGLFKACGYRYNEENMIKLFIRFPWAAYCDELLDRRDIIPMLNELAGFKNKELFGNSIRWTHSRTRPAHFPEQRVTWLGKLMTHYYRASLSGMLYDICKEKDNVYRVISDILVLPETSSPGEGIRKEMTLNTILPLLEAMRIEINDTGSIKSKIRALFKTAKLTQAYGSVKRFHDIHGIDEKDKEQKNWLISQGVLNIRDHYCTQESQLKCPICLMEEKQKPEIRS